MRQILLTLVGAGVGAAIGFVLGLMFNTGTSFARQEITAYAVIGAIAGTVLGRLIHKIKR